jgi:hypothetical protein
MPRAALVGRRYVVERKVGDAPDGAGHGVVAVTVDLARIDGACTAPPKPGTDLLEDGDQAHIVPMPPGEAIAYAVAA